MKKVLAVMPTYTQSFTISSNSKAYVNVLYVRYFSAWGDGSRIPSAVSDVYWPQVSGITADGRVLEPLAMPLIFSQYALVKVYVFAEWDEVEEVVINGAFEQVGYCSLTLYHYYGGTTGGMIFSTQEHVQGQDFRLDTGMNPFLEGNPSVFAYARPCNETPTVKESLTSDLPYSLVQNFVQISDKPLGRTKLIKGHVGNKYDFYRPTAQMVDKATGGSYENIAADGCTNDYLFAAGNGANHEVFLLKIKLPTTFIHSDMPDSVYQAQALVFDSNLTEIGGCYAVNSRQLNDITDSNGFAYLFFAPKEFVDALSVEQDVHSTQPPLYQWGEYTGYMLSIKPAAESGLLITKRHWGADENWHGSLINTPCHLTNSLLSPIQPSDLGEFSPQLTGDTEVNFLAGKLGSIKCR